MKIKKPEYRKIDVHKLKPRRRRASNKRDTMHICPNCLSTLKPTQDGALECTGDKLKLWETEFMRYDRLKTDEDRQRFLSKLSNKSKFLELHEKRFDLECGYSNRMVDPTPTYTITIPDPLMTSMIEKSMGRELTEEEREEEYTFYSDGVNFYTEDGPHRRPFTLDRVNFPDDC